MFSEHEPEEMLREAEWMEQQHRLREIERAGGIETFLRQHPEAFHGRPKEICCIDGRFHGHREQGGICVAGSGILMLPGSEERKQYVAKMKELVAKGEVNCISSHSDCGATKIRIRQRDPNNPLNSEEVNRVAEQETRLLAEEIGIPYREQQRESHLDFHPEVTILVDGTGKFDFTTIEHLFPASFIVSAPAYPEHSTQFERELSIALQMPFNEALGFGKKKFTSEYRLHVVFIGDQANPFYSKEVLRERFLSESCLGRLNEELRQMIADRVSLEGFDMPMEQVVEQDQMARAA